MIKALGIGNQELGKAGKNPPLLKGEVRKPLSSLIPPLKTCPRENGEGGVGGI